MIKRILAALLAVLMMFPLSLIAFAAEESTEDEEEKRIDYVKAEWKSKAQRLASMKVAGISPNGNMTLYIDEGSGEMAIKNGLTGEIILTNPVDIKEANIPNREKPYTLSQIDLNYTVITTGTSKTLHSYSDCLSLGQAKFTYTPTGVKVDYILGRQEQKLAIPNKIALEDFEILFEKVKVGVYAEVESEIRAAYPDADEEFILSEVESKAPSRFVNIKNKILFYYMDLMGPESAEHGISKGMAAAAAKEYPIAATRYIYVIAKVGQVNKRKSPYISP